jgi:hypothetical protein
MRSRRATISVWAAHGVAAHIAGTKGRLVSSMGRGRRRHRSSCTLRLHVGLNGYELASPAPGGAGEATPVRGSN